MPSIRKIERIIESKPTLEGAGVRLRRVFGYNERGLLDPFLLLDHFSSDDPKDYIAGFPWHPHRGIETVTYMIEGTVEHGDSLGNAGSIHSGDVQWMSAGSGIIHVEDLVADCAYFDVEVPAKTEFLRPVRPDETTFAFVFEGEGHFDESANMIDAGKLVLFKKGDFVKITTREKGVRFLFVSGKPLEEPIAWRGPIVMNTKEELDVAFEEYFNGTFIKESGTD